MYSIEIQPGLKAYCSTPEEVLVLIQVIVDARKERERRERLEFLKKKRLERTK